MRMYKLKVNNNKYNVVVKNVTSSDATVEVNGVEQTIEIAEIKNLVQPKNQTSDTLQAIATPAKASGSAPAITKVASASGVSAPIPGQIKAIFVKEGDTINPGQKVLIMEAMKMENVINSTTSGTVQRVLVGDGDTVTQDQLLVEIA